MVGSDDDRSRWWVSVEQSRPQRHTPAERLSTVVGRSPSSEEWDEE